MGDGVPVLAPAEADGREGRPPYGFDARSERLTPVGVNLGVKRVSELEQWLEMEGFLRKIGAGGRT